MLRISEKFVVSLITLIDQQKQGKSCVGPNAASSFGAQSTNVVAAPGKPHYTFMADIRDSSQLEIYFVLAAVCHSVRYYLRYS